MRLSEPVTRSQSAHTGTLDPLHFAHDTALAAALRGYVAEVAGSVGVGMESVSLDVGTPASAYIALDWRLSRFPDRDVALLWDERRGWSAAIETHSGEDLIVLSYLGAGIVPDPSAVAWFTRSVRAEDHEAGQPTPPEVSGMDDAGLVAALAAYRHR